MLLIDASIAMYAAGAAHAYKAPSAAVLALAAAGGVHAVVDAEMLQEILHRYRAIGRASDGERVYALVRQSLPEVVAITAEVMDAANALLAGLPTASCRDAVHAAVALQLGAQICSHDRDFDGFVGVSRVEPEALLAARAGR
jgi:predicted nucleic acid-binding protein